MMARPFRSTWPSKISDNCNNFVCCSVSSACQLPLGGGGGGGGGGGQGLLPLNLTASWAGLTPVIMLLTHTAAQGGRVHSKLDFCLSMKYYI